MFVRLVAVQVYFKPNSGYKDVFGVAWPMSEEARAKARPCLLSLCCMFRDYWEPRSYVMCSACAAEN